MRSDRFDYDLPEDLIAQHPLPDRSASRLLVYDRNTADIRHARFRDLPEFLPDECCLVVNDSRVIPARLWGVKEGGGARIETLLLEDLGDGRYRVLANRARRLKAGSIVTYGPDFRAEVEERLDDGVFIVRFESDRPFLDVLSEIGEMPLPPYILREKREEEDFQRYQTVYARDPGSAAAPTAGLHFDEDLLQDLDAAETPVIPVTLHVGLDTFRPVTEETVEEHRIHTEWFRVTDDAADRINAVREKGGRVVAVGTTAVRVLESAADETGRIEPGKGKTGLYITPGYRFRAVDHLVTNFHLPRSTLILLVAAFLGDDRWRGIYETAVREKYRFYSYGDAMLIL